MQTGLCRDIGLQYDKNIENYLSKRKHLQPSLILCQARMKFGKFRFALGVPDQVEDSSFLRIAIHEGLLEETIRLSESELVHTAKEGYELMTEPWIHGRTD